MTILHLGAHTTLRLVAISTARRRHSPPKDAASPGSPTGLVVAGLATNTAATRPVSLEVCVHAEETALSTDLFPTQRINYSIKLRVVAQVPFHPAGFVIATLSNRSQTNLAAFPALYWLEGASIARCRRGTCAQPRVAMRRPQE